jgi:hypothetical protein
LELQGTVKNSLLMTAKILLLIVFAVHAFNVEYRPVTGGLDPSWQYIINYATHKRIEFIFTSGPFGFINYPLNIFSNLDIAILVRLLFWICFFGFFGYLVVKNSFALRNIAVFVGLFALGSSSLSFDYIICFVILFLLSLAFFSKRWYVFYALVIGLSALLGLMKLSAALLAISSCVVFIGITVFLDKTKALLAALFTLLGIPVLFLVFYMLYDPSFSRMLSYLRRAYDISSGYNVAMSMTGRTLELWLVLFIVLAYLLLILLLYRNKEKSSVIAITFIPAMFFAFKHGFVRQDGHEAIFFAFVPLIMGVILLFTNLKKSTRWGLVLLIPAIMPQLYVSSPSSLLGIHKLMIMSELVTYKQTKEALRAESREFLQSYRLPQDWLQVIGDRSISIFPWETAYAPANNLSYKPFPVIQAYSAYTPYLDAVNANFLEDPKTAPDFILVEWLAINNRHVLMDVPAMWLSLYRWYDVEHQKFPPFPISLLKRRKLPRFRDLELTESREYTIGDFIEIPGAEAPVVMKLSMKLNTLGTLSKGLFRVPEVTMALVGTGGHRIYRIVPDNLINGLFINFLPVGLRDVYFLTNKNQTTGKIYGIELSGEGLPLYKDTIHVEFYKISDIQIEEFVPPDLSSLLPETSSTEFDLESIRRYKPKQSAATQDGASFFIFTGWAIDSQAKGTAGGVYLEIDDKLYWAYYGFPRENIATLFNSPAYLASGFQLGIPESAIGKGHHTLAIKVLTKDQKAYYSSEGSVSFETR